VLIKINLIFNIFELLLVVNMQIYRCARIITNDSHLRSKIGL